MEPDLKELLHRKANDMRLPPDLPPITLRRARRRRGWFAAFAGTTALVIVASTITGVQLLSRSSPTVIDVTPTTTGIPTPTTEPTPSAAPTPTMSPSTPWVGTPEAIHAAIWPAVDGAQLDFLERQVAEGKADYALSPDATAIEFAVRIMGWDRESAAVYTVYPGGEHAGAPSSAAVFMWDGALGEYAPEVGTTIDVVAASTRAEDPPLWLVSRVYSGRLDVQCPPASTEDSLDVTKPLTVCGIVHSDTVGTTMTATVEYTASQLQPSEAASTADLTITGSRFEGLLQLIATYPDSDVSFAVRLLSSDGEVLGMNAWRMAVERPGIRGDQPDMTAEVADTREAILEAARAGSYEQLRRLIPDSEFTFTYGVPGEGRTMADKAIAYWQRDGDEPLRIMGALLEMPYTTIPFEDGVIYAWPGIADWNPGELERIDELAPEWRSALEQIYPNFDEALQGWIKYGGYIGWRIGIADDGRWLYFVAGD